jgi:threonyl-tRNA synthetase
MVICGERELKTKMVSVRRHGLGHVGMMTLEKFVAKVKSEESSECH